MNVPNEDISIRVDDTHNVNTEHEDVEANIEYDPNCHVRTNSDENETKCSDENIWHSTDDNDDDREKLVTLHLMITMKQTRLLMNLLMHLLLKSNFINLHKKVHRDLM